DAAPKLQDIPRPDIKHGIGRFAPAPGNAVPFAPLKATLKKAGYTLDSAEITVAGTLVQEGPLWFLEVDGSKQQLLIEGTLAGRKAGDHVEISGDWQTRDEGGGREVIRLKMTNRASSSATAGNLTGIEVSLSGVGAPVRTTNPGLTVFKGGGIVPRYFFTQEHLGALTDTRQTIRVGLTYTPTPTLQLEAEVPYQYLSFDQGFRGGSAQGFGNITLWGKYRFFRTLETWGDKQAAARIGVELPTGSTASPGQAQLAEPAFVRQQLSPIAGGTALHSEMAYSQAWHRFIYGADVEGTIRGERDGYRLGNEVRLNTDLEYVLLPRKYQSPGKELFAILETTLAYRARGRSGGLEVPGSSSAVLSLAPGAQV